MTPLTPLIELARDIMLEAHRGQFRRDGSTPYGVHPSRVLMSLRMDDEPEHVCALDAVREWAVSC